MESIFKNKKIIVGVVVIIIAFFAYNMFFVSGSESDTGNLSRRSVSSLSENGDITDLEDGPAKEFVTQLLAIQNITFKMSLFDDVVFKNMVLVDDTIQPQPQGRRNPFLPFEVVDGVITPTTQDLGEVSPVNNQTSTSSKAKVTVPKPKRTR